jgi:hypothetical protein
MNAVELGSVPAAEGIEQIGEAFTMLAEESLKVGDVVDAGILQMIRRARELGQEIPEIAEFVQAELQKAAEGLGKIGGIQILTAEDAAAQATIVTATFFATMAEQGLLAAADALRPAWEALKESLKSAGMDAAIPGMDRLMQIASEDAFRPLLEGVEGLNQALTGLSNAGYMTTDAFAAFQQQGISAFEQLKAAGLTEQEALLQMAPMLQNLQEAAAAYGMSLDPATQALIDQAEASGIAFKTEPMQQMVDVMKLVAEALGVSKEKLDEIGGSAATAGEAVQGALGGAAESVVGSVESMASAAGEALGMVGGAGEDAAKVAEDKMRESMAEIAAASVAATTSMEQDFIDAAKEAAAALGTIPRSLDIDVNTHYREFGKRGGKGSGGGPDRSAQSGMHELLSRDMTIAAHRGEMVHIDKPERMPVSSGAAAVNVTGTNLEFHVHGVQNPGQFEQWIESNASDIVGKIFRKAGRMGVG